MLCAVATAPDWVTVAFHAWLICCPLAKVRVAVHAAEVAVDVLVTVTSPWKPPPHWETRR